MTLYERIRAHAEESAEPNLSLNWFEAHLLLELIEACNGFDLREEETVRDFENALQDLKEQTGKEDRQP